MSFEPLRKVSVNSEHIKLHLEAFLSAMREITQGECIVSSNLPDDIVVMIGKKNRVEEEGWIVLKSYGEERTQLRERNRLRAAT